MRYGNDNIREEFILLVKGNQWQLIQDWWDDADWPFCFLGDHHGCPSQVKYDDHGDTFDESLVNEIKGDPFIPDMNELAYEEATLQILRDSSGKVWDAFVKYQHKVGNQEEAHT